MLCGGAACKSPAQLRAAAHPSVVANPVMSIGSKASAAEAAHASAAAGSCAAALPVRQQRAIGGKLTQGGFCGAANRRVCLFGLAAYPRIGCTSDPRAVCPAGLNR